MVKLTANEWQELCEIESILNISKDLTTWMQLEQAYTSAYGTVIKHITLQKLRSP